MRQITVDDLLSYIGSAGFVYKVVDRDGDRRVRILLENAGKVPSFLAKFSGRRPYRDPYGRTYVGGVRQVSGRQFDVFIE